MVCSCKKLAKYLFLLVCLIKFVNLVSSKSDFERNSDITKHINTRRTNSEDTKRELFIERQIRGSYRRNDNRQIYQDERVNSNLRLRTTDEFGNIDRRAIRNQLLNEPSRRNTERSTNALEYRRESSRIQPYNRRLLEQSTTEDNRKSIDSQSRHGRRYERRSQNYDVLRSEKINELNRRNNRQSERQLLNRQRNIRDIRQNSIVKRYTNTSNNRIRQINEGDDNQSRQIIRRTENRNINVLDNTNNRRTNDIIGSDHLSIYPLNQRTSNQYLKPNENRITNRKYERNDIRNMNRKNNIDSRFVTRNTNNRESLNTPNDLVDSSRITKVTTDNRQSTQNENQRRPIRELETSTIRNDNIRKRDDSRRSNSLETILQLNRRINVSELIRTVKDNHNMPYVNLYNNMKNIINFVFKLPQESIFADEISEPIKGTTLMDSRVLIQSILLGLFLVHHANKKTMFKATQSFNWLIKPFTFTTRSL